MAKSTPSAGMPWSPTIGLYGRRTPSTEVTRVHTNPRGSVHVDPWFVELVSEAAGFDEQADRVPARVAAKAMTSTRLLREPDLITEANHSFTLDPGARSKSFGNDLDSVHVVTVRTRHRCCLRLPVSG